MVLLRRQFAGLQLMGTTNADERGRFTFDSLPIGEYFVASAWPGGGNRYQPGNLPCVFADQCLIPPGSEGIRLTSTTETVSVELQVDLPVVVSGRIVSDGDGAPIEGARVSADGGLRETRSDADGRYRLSGFNPGRIGLRASAPGRVGRIHPGIGFDPLLPRLEVRETLLHVGENPGLNFSLARGARLRGSARSSLSGVEVSDVVLYRTSGVQSLWQVATTPCSEGVGGVAGGCFEIDGLFPGSFTLAAANAPNSNYVATYWPDVPCGATGCFPGGGTQIFVEAGQTVDGLELRVSPRRWVAGTVREATTVAPIAGATVIAMRPISPGFGAAVQIDHANTDAAGRFVLDNVPAGAIDVIVVDAADRLGRRWPDEDCTTTNRFCTTGTAPGRIAVPSQGVVDGIDIELLAGAQIAGAIRAAGEGPVAGALVLLSWAFAGSSASRTTRSDAKGNFRFGTLPPGAEFHLAAQRPLLPGTVFHPDKWCNASNCGALGGIPVTTPSVGTLEADIVMPGLRVFDDGFESLPQVEGSATERATGVASVREPD